MITKLPTGARRAMGAFLMVALLAALFVTIVSADVTLAKTGKFTVLREDGQKDGQDVISIDIYIAVDGVITALGGNRATDHVSVSDDEWLVAHTWSTNLVSKGHGCAVVLKDLRSDSIELVRDGARLPTISKDGRFVAYEYADDYDKDLPGPYVYDTRSGKHTFVGYTSGGNQWGWKTQVFEFSSSGLVYNTSYPGGWHIETYKVPGAKVS